MTPLYDHMYPPRTFAENMLAPNSTYNKYTSFWLHVTTYFLVPIQIQPKSQFDFVPRDTAESESLDLVDFGGVAIPVDSIMYGGFYVEALQPTATRCNTLQHTATHCNMPQYTATHCNALQRAACTQDSMRHVGFIIWRIPYEI